MPAYNAERYLDTAVESVLRQTCRDLELLVIDDGSTDGTAAAAGRWSERDARVRVHSQPNAGPGPARTLGFHAAAGRFFAFLDSDDEWDDTFLAEQIAILDARPDVDVVIGNARNRGGARDGQPSRPVRGEGMPITLADMLADETLLFIMTVFRREVAEAVGGFDPQFLTNEEYEMWLRAALAGYNFTRNPKPLGWYACRAESLSSSDARMLRGILRVLAKTRPALPIGSAERTILDKQAARFEVEAAAAEAHDALDRRDLRTAASSLEALSRRRGGIGLAIAARAMRVAPRAALWAYQLRRQARRAAGIG